MLFCSAALPVFRARSSTFAIGLTVALGGEESKDVGLLWVLVSLAATMAAGS